MITVGLDVGGTKVLGVAVDDQAPGVVVASRRVPTPDGGLGLVDVLGALVTELAGRAGPPAAVGVGVPGIVDHHGTLHLGPHLRHLRAQPLAAQVSALTGIPSVVDNDANCHAVAEHRAGAARGVAEAVMVTLGTGVGGGVITGGRLVRGAHGFAGELGHMVVDPNGPPCPCGKQGCWERYASGTGLGRMAREAAEAGRLLAVVALAGGDEEAVRGEHVTAAARAGDEAASQVLDQLAWWIALGLANVANILDPSVMVIGGGLVEAADLLLAPVRSHFAALVMGADDRPTSIVAAALGEEAGAIGAAALAADLVAGGPRPPG